MAGTSEVETVLCNTFCVHISNLSPITSAQELAKKFGIPIQYILIDTTKNEAWIKNCYPWNHTESIAAEHDGEIINKKRIKCEAIQERIPIDELCRHDRITECRFGNKCSKKHVMCENPKNCLKKDCYYGHEQYQVSDANPWPNRFGQTTMYRVKISELPLGITIQSLETKLIKPKQGQFVILKNQTSTLTAHGVIAYLRKQSSEKMARKFVQQWDGKEYPGTEYRNGIQIKCQLEIDHNDIDSQIKDFKKVQFENNEDDDSQELSQDTLTTLPPLLINESTGVVPKKSKKTLINENTIRINIHSDDQTMFEFPEDLKKKNEWEYIHGLNTTETGQGEVYLIRKRSGDRTEAALKVYKRLGNRNKCMRSHREMIALRTMTERRMNMPLNIISLIQTNIPDHAEDTVKSKDPLWIIVSVARGCSLAEYRKKYPSQEIGLREALVFCLKLLHIVKSINACGIVHRDLKPDNIHIDCENNQSLEKGHITILDFGLAFIEESTLTDDTELDEIEDKRLTNEFATDLGDTLGNIWYRVPQLYPQKTSGLTEIQKNQLKQQRRSPSIDVSSICAFLYWLLAKEIPGEYYAKKEAPPHRKMMQSNKYYWDTVVRKAIDTSGSKCDRSRLQLYLMHAFDRGFAGPTDQWSIKELLQHLNIMYTWLDNGNIPNENSLNLYPISPSSSSSFLNGAFQTAADLFQAAKLYSVKKFSSERKELYHWNIDQTFHWIDEIAIDQRTNVDSLHCYSPPGIIWIMQIFSLAKIDEENNINLFVGSIIDGVNIRLPIDILPSSNQVTSKSQSVQSKDVQQEEQVKKFANELSTLIDLFCRTQSK